MGRSRMACLNFSAYILAQKQGTRAEKTAVTAISRKLLCAGHCGPQRRIRRKSLRQRRDDCPDAARDSWHRGAAVLMLGARDRDWLAAPLLTCLALAVGSPPRRFVLGRSEPVPFKPLAR